MKFFPELTPRPLNAEHGTLTTPFACPQSLANFPFLAFTRQGWSSVVKRSQAWSRQRFFPGPRRIRVNPTPFHAPRNTQYAIRSTHPPIACQFPFPCFHPSRLVKRSQA